MKTTMKNSLNSNIKFDDKNKFLNYVIHHIRDEEDVDLTLPYSNEEKVHYISSFDDTINVIVNKITEHIAFVEEKMLQLTGNAINRIEYLASMKKANDELKKSLDDIGLQKLYYQGCKNGYKKGFESALSFTKMLGSFQDA